MILTKKRFAEAIETVVSTKGLNYIDAIIFYCEKEHLDPESVKNLITPPLKEKIEVDAMSYNMLKPNAKKGEGSKRSVNEVMLLQKFVKDNITKNHLQRDRRRLMHGNEESRLIRFVKCKHWKLIKEHIGINCELAWI